MEIHEVHEKAEEAHHKNNKRAALLIVIIAALLAIVEMAGKEAQFEAIAGNIEVTDLYAFYQAKTIRRTVIRTAAETVPVVATDPALGEAQKKQHDAWKKELERLESDPTSGEGRKELLERAKEKEKHRDHKIHAYHMYEYAAAMLQLAIVMASAAVITEVILLEGVSVVFGLAGLAFALLGWLAPDLVHL